MVEALLQPPADRAGRQTEHPPDSRRRKALVVSQQHDGSMRLVELGHETRHEPLRLEATEQRFRVGGGRGRRRES